MIICGILAFLIGDAFVRGIDHPGGRTCLRRIQLSFVDGIVMAVFLGESGEKKRKSADFLVYPDKEQ